MQPDDPNLHFHGIADRVLGQIAYCLRQGSVICIEHAFMTTPRWTPWEAWGKPCYYNGNAEQIYREIEHCRQAHADRHIRLNIEDYGSHSRFLFVVHSPVASLG